MGGSGSGRPSSYGLCSDKCEEYHSIDLAWLRSQHLLHVGRSAVITWSRAGRTTGSIQVEFFENSVRLIYRQQRHGEKSINEIVPLVKTATPFGGSRQWFRCLSCGSRCRILYGGAHFRCRKCHRLKYQSQYEAAYSRACSQSHALRRRLGHVGSLDDPFPPKPKGMHWKTYRNLENHDEDLQNRWAVGVWNWMKRL
jgi:hypothetical protein